jgi:hypothetical protein
MNKDMLEFILSKVPNKEKAIQDYCRKAIFDLANSGGTLADLEKRAKKEGWFKLLQSMPICYLNNPVANGSRASKSEATLIRERIVEYVKAHPWSSRSAIAEAISEPATRVSNQLYILRDKRVLKSAGSKATTRYALYKPVTPPILRKNTEIIETTVTPPRSTLQNKIIPVKVKEMQVGQVWKRIDPRGKGELKKVVKTEYGWSKLQDTVTGKKTIVNDSAFLKRQGTKRGYMVYGQV